MKLRTDDEVIVIAGKDKGKTGKVLRVDLKNDKVYVEGLNVVKRHQRPTPAQEGGIVSKEASIHISNLAHVDPTDGKATRVGWRTLEDGSKVRVAKRSGEVIDA